MLYISFHSNLLTDHPRNTLSSGLCSPLIINSIAKITLKAGRENQRFSLSGVVLEAVFYPPYS